MVISLIIPLLNEESLVLNMLDELSSLKDCEIIFVDGGSSDQTCPQIEAAGRSVLRSKSPRAHQMNQGAGAAKGDILVFLHADCLIRQKALTEICRYIQNGYIGGCLSQRIDSPLQRFRWVEKSGNARAKWFKIFYGDQAIFVRKDVFMKIHGFDEVPLLEDVLFSKKMHRAGPVAVLPDIVEVSPRRWQKQGVIKTTIINWFISASFLLGVSPRRLKKFYSDIR